ncbi:RDD family protein [Oricola cellulosilytica]|uniref:RDD family protein n=1 Tax=Oricola cellulosilytica TaxID=1429082 RepID=A0A4R0PAW0_9HYPH|nr:RDD family protein [Oricola cellulosilytica]TCD14382.1 RDD family protein [Oricola cellulosilytica]
MSDPQIMHTAGERMASRFDDWRLFEGVRTRRIIAFLIDYAMVILLILIAVPLIFVLGFATFGAAWLLYLMLSPLVALTYVGWTIGGPSQATIGMRLTGVRLERYDGRKIDFLTAVVHAVLFWASAAIFLPLLLAPLVLEHKRTLHDLALGTVVVRSGR